MFSASLHLLIGALLVLAVENEATTTMTSKENTTALVSMSINTTKINKTDDFLKNCTTLFPPFSNVTLPSTKDVNSSDYISDMPTTYPSEHPQTSNANTDDPRRKNVTQSSTVKTSKKNTVKSTQAPTTVENHGKATKAPETEKSNGQVYIIILIIVAVCISGVVIYCCLQKKSRRYSVDLHPRQEDAHIPLSTVDVEVFDTTSVKDMQTFTPVESTEPLKDPVKEAEKPEGGKESVDVKQENQQNLSSTQTTVIPKDKTEELTVVDLNDVEPTISTKTSMESLDDVLNENNSNNTRAGVNGKVHKFTEISLDGLL